MLQLSSIAARASADASPLAARFRLVDAAPAELVGDVLGGDTRVERPLHQPLGAWNAFMRRMLPAIRDDERAMRLPLAGPSSHVVAADLRGD